LREYIHELCENQEKQGLKFYQLSCSKEALGRIDIMVNNAGVMLLGNIEGADTREWRQHITNPEVRKAQQEAEQSITPLRGEDIAAAIVFAVTQPEHVSISEMLVRPTQQV
jgi:NADP-dependent 3-hydroxy acid dehydrogenase YdfG